MTEDTSRGQEPTQEPAAGGQQPQPPSQGPSQSPPQQPPGPQMGGQPAPPGPPPPPAPPPKKPRSNRWLIPVSLCIGCLPWFIIAVIVMAAVFGAGTAGDYGEHIALIHVNGVITGGRSGSSVFGDRASGAEDLIDQLEQARLDDDAAAVVIRINSPGGSAAGSEEVFNEIRRVRNDGKPVYASMGDVAASGGYYIASACNKIYADKCTVTGSIGVIFETADLSELFDKIGVNPQTITAGKYKDIGSLNRPMTAEERKLLQSVVDDTYGHFVKAVADGRQMSVEEVKKLADGRIFSGSQAHKNKLVDEIGGLHEATRAAADAAGIEGEPDVLEYGEWSWFETIFGTEASSSGVQRGVDRFLLERLLSRMDSQGRLR